MCTVIRYKNFMKKLILFAILLVSCSGDTFYRIDRMKFELHKKQQLIDANKDSGNHKTACELYNSMLDYLSTNCPGLEKETSMCENYDKRERNDCSKYTL